MGIYAITGGATGIGAAVVEQLRGRGETVIVADIKQADIQADLSTQQGRLAAVEGIKSAAPGGLDGLILCAGLGPHVSPSSLIVRVNYFGVTGLVNGLRDLVAEKKGNIIIISSNSASMPTSNPELVEAMLAGDENKAGEIADQGVGFVGYVSSKKAVTQWMRRHAPEFIRQGVRINAVAPGVTQTPLLEGALADANHTESLKEFVKSLPIGYIAQPAEIANAVLLLMSELGYACGSVLFIDGGYDAMARPDQF